MPTSNQKRISININPGVNAVARTGTIHYSDTNTTRYKDDPVLTGSRRCSESPSADERTANKSHDSYSSDGSVSDHANVKCPNILFPGCMGCIVDSSDISDDDVYLAAMLTKRKIKRMKRSSLRKPRIDNKEILSCSSDDCVDINVRKVTGSIEASDHVNLALPGIVSRSRSRDIPVVDPFDNDFLLYKRGTKKSHVESYISCNRIVKGLGALLLKFWVFLMSPRWKPDKHCLRHHSLYFIPPVLVDNTDEAADAYYFHDSVVTNHDTRIYNRDHNVTVEGIEMTGMTSRGPEAQASNECNVSQFLGTRQNDNSGLYTQEVSDTHINPNTLHDNTTITISDPPIYEYQWVKRILYGVVPRNYRYMSLRSNTVIYDNAEDKDDVNNASGSDMSSKVSTSLCCWRGNGRSNADNHGIYEVYNAIRERDKHRYCWFYRAFKKWQSIVARWLKGSCKRLIAFRMLMFTILNTTLFEAFMFINIIISCVFIDKPLWMGLDAYFHLNVFFAVVFCLEMIMKVFTMGFIMHPGSYLRSWWNSIDFILVVLSINNVVSDFNQFPVFHYLRVLRLLRSLKIIHGMRVVIHGLINSAPDLIVICCISLVLQLIMSVIAMTMWSGSFQRRCYDPYAKISFSNMFCAFDGEDIGNTVEARRIITSYHNDKSMLKVGIFGSTCPDGLECSAEGSQNPFFGYGSFDNMLSALLFTFVITSLNGWSEILFISYHVFGYLSFIYFFSLILAGHFFIHNIMLAVINESFIRALKLEARRLYSRNIIIELEKRAQQDSITVVEGDNDDFDDQFNDDTIIINGKFYVRQGRGDNRVSENVFKDTEVSGSGKVCHTGDKSRDDGCSLASTFNSQKEIKLEHTLPFITFVNPESRTISNIEPQLERTTPDSSINNESFTNSLQGKKVAATLHTLIRKQKDNKSKFPLVRLEPTALFPYQYLGDTPNCPRRMSLTPGTSPSQLFPECSSLIKASSKIMHPTIRSRLSKWVAVVPCDSMMYTRYIDADVSKTNINQPARRDRKGSDVSSNSPSITKSSMGREESSGHCSPSNLGKDSGSMLTVNVPSRNPSRGPLSSYEMPPRALEGLVTLLESDLFEKLMKSATESKINVAWIKLRHYCHLLSEGYPLYDFKFHQKAVSFYNSWVYYIHQEQLARWLWNHMMDECSSQHAYTAGNISANSTRNHTNEPFGSLTEGNPLTYANISGNRVKSDYDTVIPDVREILPPKLPTLLSEEKYLIHNAHEGIIDGKQHVSLLTIPIAVVIVLNIVFLALHHYGEPQWIVDLIDISNYVFISLFSLEIVIQMLAVGLFRCVNDYVFIFDALVLAISIMELHTWGLSVTVLRALRLVRVIKLFHMFPTLRNIIDILLTSLSRGGYVLLFLLFFEFSEAIAATRLFPNPLQYANDRFPYAVFTTGLNTTVQQPIPATVDHVLPSSLPFDSLELELNLNVTTVIASSAVFLTMTDLQRLIASTSVLSARKLLMGGNGTSSLYTLAFLKGFNDKRGEEEHVLRLETSFDKSVVEAFYTVFQVFTVHGWTDLLWASMKAHPGMEIWSALYFVILFFIGNDILSGLFLVLLLSSFFEIKRDADIKREWDDAMQSILDEKSSHTKSDTKTVLDAHLKTFLTCRKKESFSLASYAKQLHRNHRMSAIHSRKQKIKTMERLKRKLSLIESNHNEDGDDTQLEGCSKTSEIKGTKKITRDQWKRNESTNYTGSICEIREVRNVASSVGDHCILRRIKELEEHNDPFCINASEIDEDSNHTGHDSHILRQATRDRSKSDCRVSTQSGVSLVGGLTNISMGVARNHGAKALERVALSETDTSAPTWVNPRYDQWKRVQYCPDCEDELPPQLSAPILGCSVDPLEYHYTNGHCQVIRDRAFRIARLQRMKHNICQLEDTLNTSIWDCTEVINALISSLEGRDIGSSSSRFEKQQRAAADSELFLLQSGKLDMITNWNETIASPNHYEHRNILPDLASLSKLLSKSMILPFIIGKRLIIPFAQSLIRHKMVNKSNEDVTDGGDQSEISNILRETRDLLAVCKRGPDPLFGAHIWVQVNKQVVQNHERNTDHQEKQDGFLDTNSSSRDSIEVTALLKTIVSILSSDASDVPTENSFPTVVVEDSVAAADISPIAYVAFMQRPCQTNDKAHVNNGLADGKHSSPEELSGRQKTERQIIDILSKRINIKVPMHELMYLDKSEHHDIFARDNVDDDQDINGDINCTDETPYTTDTRSILAEALGTMRANKGNEGGDAMSRQHKDIKVRYLKGIISNLRDLTTLHCERCALEVAKELVDDELFVARRQETGTETVGGACKKIARGAILDTTKLTNGGNSLFIFGPTNSFRVASTTLYNSHIFEIFVMFCILCSCVLLVLANPQYTFTETEKKIFFILDVILITVFVFHLLVGFVAKGVFFNHSAYLRNPWHVLDAVVIGLSIVVMILTYLFPNIHISIYLKSIKSLKALLPLQLVTHTHELRVLTLSLLKSVKALAHVFLLSLGNYIIFGIIGVHLFAGKFQHCTDPVVTDRANCIGTYTFVNYGLLPEGVMNPIQSEELALAERLFIPPIIGQRRWISRRYNFDHLGEALLTLLRISTGDSWSTVLSYGISAVDENTAPTHAANLYAGFYFVVFFGISNLIFINQFITVVVYNINKVIKRHGETLITGDMSFVNLKRIFYRVRPRITVEKPNVSHYLNVHAVMKNDPVTGRRMRLHNHIYPLRNRIFANLRLFCYRMAVSQLFEIFIFACILMNSLVIALDYEGISETFADVLLIANYVFTFIFVVEILVRMAGESNPLNYFRSHWHRFDFFIVVISLVDFVVTLTENIRVNLSVLRMVRLLRALRLLRLFEQSTKVEIVMDTILFSIPSLGSVFVLLGIIYFIFAVIGNQLFSGINSGAAIDVFLNFSDVWKSVQALFLLSTGDHWGLVMQDSTVLPNCNPADEHCGNMFANLYFFTFIIITIYILRNTFIEVIFGNYSIAKRLSRRKDTRSVTSKWHEKVKQMDKIPITTESEVSSNRHLGELHVFATVWSKFDPAATYLIPTHKLLKLLTFLPPPMGFARSITGENSKQHFLYHLRDHMPRVVDRSGYLHFSEAIIPLARAIIDEHLTDAERKKNDVLWMNHINGVKSLPITRIRNCPATVVMWFAATFIAATVKMWIAKRKYGPLLANSRRKKGCQKR